MPVRLLTFAFALLLVAAACGGADGDATGEPAATAPATADATPDQTGTEQTAADTGATPDEPVEDAGAGSEPDAEIPAESPTGLPVIDGPVAPDFVLPLAGGALGDYQLSAAQKPVYMVFWAEW